MTKGGYERRLTQRRTRKFGGRTYFLYGRGDTKSTARAVGKAVRDNGGLARVVGLEIWARKTPKWK